ncbi:MAG TPA: hypothetical protein VJN71_08310 [Nitrososphaerales archaeon]|nr:hypothetical protein [Nitrososphaerales archaeon]
MTLKSQSSRYTKQMIRESSRSDSDRLFFKSAAVAVAIFYSFLVYMHLQQGVLFFNLFVFQFTAIATGAVIIYFILLPPNRLMKLLYVTLAASFIVIVLSMIPTIHGYPVSNYSTGFSCVTRQGLNATYLSAQVTDCSPTTDSSLVRISWNLAYWLAASGLVLFGVFSWKNERAVNNSSLAFLVNTQ